MDRASRIGVGIVIALGVALVGCGGREDDDPSDEPTRGPPRRGPSAQPIALDEVGERTAAGSAREREAAEAQREATRTPHAWGAEPIVETTTTEEVTPPTPAARDYASELQAALGVPTDCVDQASAAAAAGGTLRIPVRVVVTEGGRVTRAEVSGSLPEEGRACVQRRAERVSMRAPIEGAPRTISATIELAVRAPPEPEAARAPEWQRPAGAQAPGVTLPAVAPAAGTLPGRPPGYVPPSSTLPATGS